MTRSFLTSMPCSSDWLGPHRLGPSMPPAVSGADPPWIGVSPFSKVRGRSLEDYNQFRLGVVNYSLRSSFSRPSAYRQRADDVSRAATRGMMDTQLARVSGLPKPPILFPNHGCHHRQRTGRGQSEWLVLLCRTLSFPIPNRFNPALSLTPLIRRLLAPQARLPAGRSQ